MLAHGSARRFHMPETNEEMLRALLGDILSTERERQLANVAVSRSPTKPTRARRSTSRRRARPGGGFDSVFLRTSSHASMARP